jgi:aspartate carbamoyltransferase catalytic subunit
MDIQVKPMRHVLKTQQFSLVELEELFNAADQLQSRREQVLEGKILCSLFYEPSTRTRFSFESAMLRLGGGVISTDNAKGFSSAAKGESLRDTIRVVGHYADIIVLRHDDGFAAERAAEVSAVPIINAGCGKEQHPTQALLDLYTIRGRRKDLSGLRVAMMGDLKYGRTVRSLAYLLAKFPGVEMYFVSPEELRLDQGVRAHLQEHRVHFCEYESVDDIIDVVDVLYVTRPQVERMHEDERPRLEKSYRLHGGLAQRMREGSIIMHPLPRTDELSVDVDGKPGAVYLTEQIESGLVVRMALLQKLLT